MPVLRSILLRALAWTIRPPQVRDRVPQRILVIKPDHLGDLLLLTPALRHLRRSFPAAHITLMIGPWSLAAVRGNSDIDCTLTCDFPGFTRRPKRGLLQPYALLLRTALLVRAGRYDTAIIARDDHWWGAALTLLAHIPRRLGYAAPDVYPLLSDALPYDPAEHVTKQALALVEYLVAPGRQPSKLPANILQVAPILLEDRSWAALWLEAHGIVPDRPLVAIHPGAGGMAKLWIGARWTSVTNALLAEGRQVIMTGGAEESLLVRRICAGVVGTVHTIIGEATLGQLAAIFERCDLVVGVDSGPLHLAAATGVRTVVLFGPGDHRRFGPWGPPERHRVVRSDFWCSPCGVLGACPRGTKPSECMAHLPTSHVLRLLLRPEEGATAGRSKLPS
jgi:ADP-heptose:LPS heptosyltransferase